MSYFIAHILLPAAAGFISFEFGYITATIYQRKLKQKKAIVIPMKPLCKYSAYYRNETTGKTACAGPICAENQYAALAKFQAVLTAPYYSIIKIKEEY